MATILVIDDEAGIRSLVRSTLERVGHRVVEAADGRIGVQLAASETPDLIVTDMLMPEQEGLETIRELRRRGIRAPIIAMSGGGRTARMDFLNVAREFGANVVLKKPFRPARLTEITARLLGEVNC